MSEIDDLRERVRHLEAQVTRLGSLPGVQVLPGQVALGQSTKVTGDLTVTGELNVGGLLDGALWYFPDPPLSNPAWEHVSFSTTAKTKIDLSAVFGAPEGIKAALFYLAVRDSGSQANDTYIILGPTSVNLVGMGWQPAYVNDRYTRTSIVVPCDANGDIYYQIGASGVNTFDVYMLLMGYAK